MTSIESEEGDAARFEFNKPFGCIDIEYGSATDVIPRLDFSSPSVVWLDYDQALDATKLGDIQEACDVVAADSVLMVTVNHQIPGPAETAARWQWLKDNLQGDLPYWASEGDVTPARVAAVFYRAISNVIARSLDARNAALPDAERLGFHQLFHFVYADDAKMLTVGGLVSNTDSLAVAQSGELFAANHIRRGEEAYRLTVPNLTVQELRALNRQLPREGAGTELELNGLPAAAIESYSSMYRFVPGYIYAES